MFSLRKEPTGFTLVELLVVFAVATIVYLGIAVLIKFATKSMWSLKGNLDLTDQASGAMQFISTDFKYAKASSMGNLAENPGFEEQGSFTATLPGWDGAIGTGYYVDRTLPDNVHNKGGFRTLELKSGPTAYFTNSITIPTTKPYLISSWAKANNTTASLSLVKDDKSDFLPPVQVGSNNNYYVHLTSTVTLNAGQIVRKRLSIAVDSWGVNHTFTGPTVTDVVVFRNKLYAGVWNSFAAAGGSKVYVLNTTWQEVKNFLTETFYRMYVYQDKLYVGIDNSGPVSKFHIYDGNSWNAVALPGIGESGGSFCEYAGKLYIGTGVNGGQGSLYSYDGNNLVGIYTFPVFEHVISLCEYNGKLYIGVMHQLAWGKMYTYDGLNVLPIPAPPNQAMQSLCVYSGKLYAGTRVMNGGQVNVYDDATNSWNVVFSLITGPWISYSAIELCVYNGKLYALLTQQWLGRIYVYDGSSWTLDYNLGGDPGRALCVFDKKLFAATEKPQAPFNGKLYVLGSSGFFDDVSISPVAVVFDSSTVVNGVANVYRYQTSKGRAETDIYRFKLYRLEFKPITARNNIAYPGILYRKKSTDGGTTWQPDGLKDDGAICENVERLRIFNRQQESFDVELDLRKIIETGSGKEQTYKTRTTIKPNIP